MCHSTWQCLAFQLPEDEAAEDEEEGTVEETGRRKPKEKEEEDHAEDFAWQDNLA